MMYGIHKELTKENIFEKISSYKIFKRYCKGFEEIGRPFKSPLRDDDVHPSSFIIYYNGDLLFKDFGRESYRCIDFVMQLFHLSYGDALHRINEDFDLGLGEINHVYTTVRHEIEEPILKEKSVSVIRIKRREWNLDDDFYWYGRYYITRKTLDSFSVHPISHFSINEHIYFASKLAYSYDYYWEKDVFRRKIYQPLSENKWYSNGGLVVQGEGMLPSEGDLLIITSSLKDVMTLYELGYVAIAPTSESTFVPEKYMLKHRSKWKRIILFMDSDEAGMIANRKLSEKWGLDYISITEAKDISDLVWHCGQKQAKKILYEVIRKRIS
jgi:hypothetical protein